MLGRQLIPLLLMTSSCITVAGDDRDLPPGVDIRVLGVGSNAEPWSFAPADEAGTRLPVGERHDAALVGKWEERDTMWDDVALLYSSKKGIQVWEGGGLLGHPLWSSGERESTLTDAAWSADGSTLYAWLNTDEQLCAIDARTAAVRSLTDLDRHINGWNPWHFWRHYDPNPESRPLGIVEDAKRHRLLMLLDEEHNADVSFWQKRPGRGGCWLEAIDLETGESEALFDKERMPELALRWDISLERGRFFALTLPKPVDEYQPGRAWRVEERRLDGVLVSVFTGIDGLAGALQLSPDGMQLIVERRYKPGTEIPSGGLDDLSRDQLHWLNDQTHGGFVVIDLDSGEILDGPHSGEQARWSPDGQHIAYVDGWDLIIGATTSRTLSRVIRGSPPADDWYYNTWLGPVWSSDGRRLAICAPNLDLTVLLDLERREYLILEGDYGAQLLWAPTPHPFGRKPGRST